MCGGRHASAVNPLRAGPCLGVIAGDRAFVFRCRVPAATRNLTRHAVSRLAVQERVYRPTCISIMGRLGELVMQVLGKTANGDEPSPFPVHAVSMKSSTASTRPTG